jgi:predicted RNA-binding Zn-ribbon protein involved in translation (DUF1610 family)
MHCTDPETIKAAKKLHRCSWCGQRIEIGDSYKRWRCYDGGEAGTVKMHPECDEACAEELRKYGENEFMPYDNERPVADSVS